jgi:internalin A
MVWKRQLNGWIIAIICALAAAPIASAADIRIPDKNLEKVILGILRSEKITAENLLKISVLHADRKDIADLSGLEHCANLLEIRLAHNRIKSVAPLAKCTKLQSVDLTDNSISDITPLEKLVKLQYLKLDDNSIESIEVVKGLKALTSIYLDHNKVTSLKPVSGLPKLQAIYAAGNQVSDIEPLKDVKWLASLDLSGNKVKDIRPLTGLTELRWTFLMKNEIEDVGPLVEMARKDADGDQRFAPFWRLYLADNPLNKASKSKHLGELKKIGVRLDMEYVRKKKAAKNVGQSLRD